MYKFSSDAFVENKVIDMHKFFCIIVHETDVAKFAEAMQSRCIVH
jgi:hypothetical protein